MALPPQYRKALNQYFFSFLLPLFFLASARLLLLFRMSRDVLPRAMVPEMGATKPAPAVQWLAARGFGRPTDFEVEARKGLASPTPVQGCSTAQRRYKWPAGLPGA